MPITTFAAIDVGSNELSMKVYEISKKYGIRELDFLRHTIELGSEAYTFGKISHGLVNETCEVILDFAEKMKEYNVTEYSACATSALREATNNLMILDQIKLRSGIKVKIISNSEQRFLCYKAIALKENAFHKIIQKGTAVVEVGAGSIQISIFDKESLVSTQNIKLGALRIRELLSDLEDQAVNFNNIVAEYVNNDIQTFKHLFLKENKIKNIIAIGDSLPDMVKYLVDLARENGVTSMDNNICYDSISREHFQVIFNLLRKKSTEAISKELGISKEQAALVLPTALIYERLFLETKAEFMWLPGITLCDGIAADHAEKKAKIFPKHDFCLDIITAARNISNRYECNEKHIQNVEYAALNIFDHIKKLHGLGKRERLLLQIAVILYRCGEFINMEAVYENSYHIIMSTEIIGLSHYERVIIANLVRYNVMDFPNFLQMEDKIDRDTYIKLSKLAAIFRLSTSLDRSNKQKLTNIRISLNENEMIISAGTLEDISLEKSIFEKKSTFFEEVFGVKPMLKQKRRI